jgi:DNA-binding NarL/FixJ family response regulator
MVAGSGDDSLSREARDAGCTEIVSNDCSIAEIIKAIRSAAREDLVVSSGSSHRHR